MPLKIVRNDITKMRTQAIVNTANEQPGVGAGCDSAIYQAAGYERLLAYRKEKIGCVPEGEVFITPGFDLPAQYIIHAVSPLYMGGDRGEEEKLRFCYRKSLRLAKEKNIRSISFPLIATGSFGYPKEEGMRIAVDEINAFLLYNEMDIFLVVFGDQATALGGKIYPGLEEYIDRNYVAGAMAEEYGASLSADERPALAARRRQPGFLRRERTTESGKSVKSEQDDAGAFRKPPQSDAGAFEEASQCLYMPPSEELDDAYISFEEEHESRLEERMRHLTDTFSQYLMYLIHEKGLTNADVYKSAIVDKKIFSKIKNNVNYHPLKLTALCLCVGAKLNLDESKDLLARAGYALSPCDKTDIIFSYFIENGIYDMIELDIQLEEHGLPCIIS